MNEPYYRRDLALVHHRGFGFHADGCAPDLIELLAPVRERDGLVLEFGCGSGLLTRYLVDAGLRVLATDASPAMLELARETAPGAEGFARLTLPDDPVPRADAIVGIGHPLNYLPTLDAIERALAALARAVRPGGLLATDFEDFEWGEARRGEPERSRVGDDWAIITRISVPTRDSFLREMTTFVRNDDGTWRRDDERHDNVLVDVSTLPALVAKEGVDATMQRTFGAHELPVGLYALVGRKRP
ncbi:MAG TPA: class I SAM-dependent methyltransferase [Acidimicrobiia bacterium]|nr:class I SAM-dependent methyltransferase [Acidimicrobiia bacterium]